MNHIAVFRKEGQSDRLKDIHSHVGKPYAKYMFLLLMSRDFFVRLLNFILYPAEHC
jgi:hypothetical protein